VKSNTIDFEFKAESITEDGAFTGYASVFNGEPDSYGDIILPGAFAESVNKGGRNGNGIAFLWQHEPEDVLGVWTKIYEDSKGLFVEGQFAMDVGFSEDKYKLLKMGAIKGLSIGYNFKHKDDYYYEVDEEQNHIRYIKKVNLWEISLVTFPANISANVSLVKKLENCNTEREFEHVLRDANLSSKSAKYLVSLCKSKFREEKSDVLANILEELKSVNNKE